MLVFIDYCLLCFLVAPRPIDGTVEQFGFIVGEEGVISVQIHANPKPKLTWIVDQHSFSEGSMDLTQRFEATSARDMVCVPSVFIMNNFLLFFFFISYIR
jgi:hypothetical protein